MESAKGELTDMNDCLNVLVRKRIAKGGNNGKSDESLPPEMAWVAKNNHIVYQRRFKPLVFSILALSAYGVTQASRLDALIATVVVLYLYIDFYSGVLHVVLDNPDFVNLPVLGVPCVEFQWHHTFPYDISTRQILDVWGDLSVLIFSKSLFLFGMCGFSETSLMVAGVGYSFAYMNQLSHRFAHMPPNKCPPIVSWLQDHRVMLPPSRHAIHHKSHDQSFPTLNGYSADLIQWLREVVPNGYAWLAFFVMLSAFDLATVTWLIDSSFYASA